MHREESISDLVTKLKKEQHEIDRRLERISEISKRKVGNQKVAVSQLSAVSSLILRHAVKEETRLAREIMQSNKAREASERWLSILHSVLQEHVRIKEFYDELPYLLKESSERQVRKNILEFVDLMVRHHAEEKKEIFPLALVA